MVQTRFAVTGISAIQINQSSARTLACCTFSLAVIRKATATMARMYTVRTVAWFLGVWFSLRSISGGGSPKGLDIAIITNLPRD